MKTFFITLFLLFIFSVPVLAQQLPAPVQSEWVLDYRYKDIVGDCETQYSLVQKDWVKGVTLFTDKTPTFETLYDTSQPYPVCPNIPDRDIYYSALTATIFIDGEYYGEYYFSGTDPEVRLTKKAAPPTPPGEFTCNVVMPTPLQPFNSSQNISRITNQSQPAQLDVDLIGNYEIPTSPSLTIQLGGYSRDINLGGLVNLKYFFYSMIMWRVFFE